MINKIKKFIQEVISELKKVAWSTKQEVIDSTWIVVISAAFLGIFIWLADTVLTQFLRLIIR